MPSLARRLRRRLLLGLAAIPLALAAAGLTLAHSPAAREVAAQSLRKTLGPPTPPPLLIADDPLPAAPLALDEAIRIPLAASEPTPPEPAPSVARPADLEGVSFVLLLGADNRDDKVTGRTDTIMLVGFRDRDGAVAAFSVPRDLWVPLPDVGSLHAEGRTHARISSVVRVGEVRLGAGQGLPLLRQVLHEQLGVRVDRYASVDFAGFVGLIDEVGGVDVDVDCPLQDCLWAGPEASSCTPLDVPAGRVHMDGATALAFVRSRHGTGDGDRTRRQQAVVLGLARQIQARGLRALPRLWAEAEPYIRTDLGADDALYYASFALDTPLTEVGGFAVRSPLVQRHVTEDGKHVLLLDHAAFTAALDELFERDLPATRARTRCPAADAALR